MKTLATTLSKTFLSFSLICTAALAVSSCQSPAVSQARTGSISIRVQFPERSENFNVKLIPAETRAIYVAVYNGRMLDHEPLLFGPITSNNPRVSLKNMDSGEKVVVAATYDAEKNMLTADQTEVFVQPGKATQVGLDMQADFGTRLSEKVLKYMQTMNIEIPDIDAPQAKELAPINSRGPQLALSSTQRNPAVPSDGVYATGVNQNAKGKISIKTPQKTSKTEPEAPAPTPTPTPYYGSSSGGGGGGFVAPAPVVVSTPTPAPTPTPDPLAPQVNIVDGSDVSGPAQGSSQE